VNQNDEKNEKNVVVSLLPLCAVRDVSDST